MGAQRRVLIFLGPQEVKHRKVFPREATVAASLGVSFLKSREESYLRKRVPIPSCLEPGDRTCVFESPLLSYTTYDYNKRTKKY